jgi:hypothetical protein
LEDLPLETECTVDSVVFRRPVSALWAERGFLTLVSSGRIRLYTDDDRGHHLEATLSMRVGSLALAATGLGVPLFFTRLFWRRLLKRCRDAYLVSGASGEPVLLGPPN